MKDRQIAVLAHDLRNPMTTITAAIHLLGRLPESDQARKEQLLLRVDRGLTRMNGMIRDLLDYARAGSGAIPIVRQAVQESSALDARRLAGHALRLATAAEIEEYLFDALAASAVQRSPSP